MRPSPNFAAIPHSPRATSSPTVSLLTPVTHPPGHEKDGIDSVPRFRGFNPPQTGPAGGDDMRLASDSPAVQAGVILPADLRTVDGAPDDERADIGFLPYGSPAMSVGVDGRRTFPRAAAVTPDVPD